MNIDQFLSDLRQFLPSDRIYTDELRTLGWGTDASFYRQIPKVVIRSDGEEEISKIVKACQKHKLPFTFRAAGTSLSGQSCTDSVLIVAGKHWEKYEIGENQDTIKMQPGIVGARVNEILKPFGRVFPPDPASIGSAMVGGIVINNASGMNCGVHANSDRMMVSARIILTDGTILDTGNEESRENFRKTHPKFIAKIEALRDKVRADEELASRIRTKYSIKNVTGLNLRPLIAYDDPFDIIAHSMVGSEGTLAFLSEVTMKTLYDYKYKGGSGRGRGRGRKWTNYSRKVNPRYSSYYLRKPFVHDNNVSSYNGFTNFRGKAPGKITKPYVTKGYVSTYSLQNFLNGASYGMRKVYKIDMRQFKSGALSTKSAYPASYRNIAVAYRHNLYKDLYAKYGASRMMMRANKAGYSNASIVRLRRNEIYNRERYAERRDKKAKEKVNVRTVR